MSPPYETPSIDEIYDLIKEIDSASKVDQIDDSWIQIHGNEKSIAFSPLYGNKDKISTLEKGAELLAENTSEIILASLPALFVLEDGPPFRVGEEVILDFELLEELPVLLREILQSTYDNYQERISARHSVFCSPTKLLISGQKTSKDINQKKLFFHFGHGKQKPH